VTIITQNNHVLINMKREGRNGQEFIMWHNARLHETLGRPTILMGVAGLMTGKTMTIVKNVLSGGEKRPQKHHKFKKDYRFFVCFILLEYNEITFYLVPNITLLYNCRPKYT